MEKKKFIKIGISALSVLYVAYSNFLNSFFTSDHVCAFFSVEFPTKPRQLEEYLASGYLAGYFYERFAYIMSKLGVTVFQNRNFFFFVILVSLAISFVLLYIIFSPYICNSENEYWIGMVLILPFINPYFVEIFAYLGWEHAIGVLWIVLAIWSYIKEKYALTVFFLALGIGSYRSFYSIFLIYVTIWLFLEHKKIKRSIFWKKAFCALGLVGGVAFINIAFTNIFSKQLGNQLYAHKTVSVETINDVTILYRIKKLFWKYYYTTVTEMGLLPKAFLLVSMFLFGLIVIVLLLQLKEKFETIFLFILSMILINIYPVSIYFLTPYYDVFARIVWPIFCSISMILFLPFCISKNNQKYSIIYKALLIAFAAVDIYSTLTAETNFFISNSLDEQIVMQVDAAIQHYEDTTGKKVTAIAAKRNEQSKESYPQIDSGYYNFTHKSMYDDWCNVELLNYYLQKDYVEIVFEQEKYDELFGDKKWDTFLAEEQLVFEDDIVYWAVY